MGCGRMMNTCWHKRESLRTWQKKNFDNVVMGTWFGVSGWGDEISFFEVNLQGLFKKRFELVVDRSQHVDQRQGCWLLPTSRAEQGTHLPKVVVVLAEPIMALAS